MFRLDFGTTYYYSDIKLNNNDNEVIISLFPLNSTTMNMMDMSQETSKLISITFTELTPSWISVNLDDKTITIDQASNHDLNFLRKIKLNYGTIIRQEELKKIDSDIKEVMLFLLLGNFMDNSNIAINNYNQELMNIPTTMSNASLDQISKLLEDHIKTQYLTFTKQDFLDQDIGPQLGPLSLQDQFDMLVGTPHVNQDIDFQIDPNTFFDPDGNNLVYNGSCSCSSCETAKDCKSDCFLKFDKENFVFGGTTDNKHKGCNFQASLNASDGFKSIVQSFSFKIYKSSPIVYALPNLTKNVTFGKEISMTYLSNTFMDLDKQGLNYEANLKSLKNMTFLNGADLNGVVLNDEAKSDSDRSEQLPHWLHFYSNQMELSGTPPLALDVNTFPGGYYQEFIIEINATDVAGQNASFAFTIGVGSRPPRENPNKTLSSQFSNLEFQMEMGKTITFDSDTFSDDFEDTISYIPYMIEKPPLISLPHRLLSAHKPQQLPSWIVFKERSFLITPPEEKLNYEYTIFVNASNKFYNLTSTNFKFKVTLSPMYLLQLIISILSAIGGLTGIFLVRKIIYAMFGKNLYCYPNYDKVDIEQNYEKPIYLIAKDLELAKMVWTVLKKKNKDISTLYQVENPEESILKEIDSVLKSLMENKCIESTEEFSSFRMYEIFIGFLMLEAIKENKAVNKIFNALKDNLMKKKWESMVQRPSYNYSSEL